MAERFRRIKRLVVVVEVILGSFVLATVTATMSKTFLESGSPAAASTSDLTGAIAVALLIGVVLFVDGLRRGRHWM
jgi:hypothetical protein